MGYLATIKYTNMSCILQTWIVYMKHTFPVDMAYVQPLHGCHFNRTLVPDQDYGPLAGLV